MTEKQIPKENKHFLQFLYAAVLQVNIFKKPFLLFHNISFNCQI